MTTKVKKSQKFAYNTSATFSDKDGNHSYTSQLYKVGIYCMFDSDPSAQFNLTPRQMVKLKKELSKQSEEGKISDLKFGREITVSEVDGFWTEVE